MNTNFPAKNQNNYSIKPFRFQLNINRIKKKNKELVNKEAELLDLLKHPTKCLHRGLFNDLLLLNDLCCDVVDDYDVSWYVMSGVFSYIHDVLCVKGSPDYRVDYSEGFTQSCDLLCDMFINYSKSVGIQRISYKKHRSIVEWFVIHLNRVVNYKHLGVLYPKDKQFKYDNKVRKEDFSYPVLIRFIDFLKQNGFIIDFTGNVLYGCRCSSMMIVNPELYDILHINVGQTVNTFRSDKQYVIVRDEEGLQVDSELLCDEAQIIVDEGIKILSKYDSYINSKTINVCGFEIPEVWFRRIMRVNYTICSRVFDDGTIQGKSKYIRSFIEIDDEATVSLDFKSLHPSILLYRVGVSIEDHDPYPSVPEIKVDKKLINKFKKFYGLEKYDPVRNIIKKLVLCLINADCVENAVGACYKDLKKDNMKKGTFQEYRMLYVGLPQINLHEIAKLIIEHNHMIKQFLGNGEGNRLQKIDSDIIVNCIDILTDLDVPVLPVHDALICKESDKKTVEKVMTDSFIKFVGEGSEKNCKIEEE